MIVDLPGHHQHHCGQQEARRELREKIGAVAMAGYSSLRRTEAMLEVIHRGGQTTPAILSRIIVTMRGDPYADRPRLTRTTAGRR